MECLAFGSVWVAWSSSPSRRSSHQRVISYPGKKIADEYDSESESHYFESTQRWRDVFTFDVDIVKLSDLLMAFFRQAKNLSRCSPTRTVTSVAENRTPVANGYLVRMGSVYSTPLANSDAPIRAKHSNQRGVWLPDQRGDVTFRLHQISKHLFFFFEDLVRARLFRCIWRETTQNARYPKDLCLLLWIFFSSLIWSSSVKLACGPTVISSATGWFWPVSDADGCLLPSLLPWPVCAPPMSFCS